MSVYSRPIAAAQRLIAKFGGSCVWTQPALVDPNADPWRDIREGAPVDYDVSIAFFSAKDLGYGSTIQLAAMAGTEVPAHSKMGIMGAVDFEPALTDTVTLNGNELDIVKIDTLAPDGSTVVLYFLWIA